MQAGSVRGTGFVEGTTQADQVAMMASSTSIRSIADGAEILPDVQLEVRQAGSRSATYTLGDIDFLIGSVAGCDLRIGGEGSGVTCLLARHPAGVTLRKLAPTQSILVNGQSATTCELNNGDQIKIGTNEIVVRVTLNQESEVRSQRSEVRGQRSEVRAEESGVGSVTPSGGLTVDSEKAVEIARQQEELIRVRKELADMRQQLYDHYQDRRDRLAALQEDLDKSRLTLDERERKLHLDEKDAEDRRQRDRKRQDEYERNAMELTQRSLRFEEARRQVEADQQRRDREWSEKNSDLSARESAFAKQRAELDAKIKQYEIDVVRLNRLEGIRETKEAELEANAARLNQQREQLIRDTDELQSQLEQLEEWRVKLRDEADRLATQKQEQDEVARQLAERTAAVEGQQASFTVLRGKMERMRDDLRERQKEIDQQQVRLDSRETELARKEEEVDKLQQAMQADHDQLGAERQQWHERSIVMDAAVRQLKSAQEALAADDERLRKQALQLQEREQQLAGSDSILQGRLAQIAETQARLDLERQTLHDRGIHLVQREEACITLQEQLHRRSEEITLRHKEITERLQEYQAKFAELEERRQQVEKRDRDLEQQLETWRADLKQRADMLQERQAEVAGFDDRREDQLNLLAIERKAHADERAQFQREQQEAVEKLTKARAELEALRAEAAQFVQEIPDAETRASAAVERMSEARVQLRGHLGEIHEYVRQCQAELEQLRRRLQGDLEQLGQQEQSLRKSQDEHRLALAGFRQQLIDWQGQIGELKRALAQDSTRLERKEAQVVERAKEMEAESQRLAEHAAQLQEQERDVADRREEMDRHLVDMRQWYRKKLRELAGIPLIPDAHSQETVGSTVNNTGVDGEDGIVPIGRSILSITAGADAGDQKLGQVLRESQLIDADTLTALLAEARRQRRSLRQVLLASGVITLYQLALIEAGNVQGLMLGPVRILDRLRHNAHESVYRVFDPRRGTEAVLRHLAEADMSDSAKPDEFRSSFTQAMLNDPHVANTLEVLELSNRPAAMQEWLTGLAATDWPPLASVPGVCFRLLTQAAQGLASAHAAGLVHGHLSDAAMLLTADGILKILGFGEPAWLIGVHHDQPPTAREDLIALGKIVSGWCTAPNVRKGPKTKPLPDVLVSILYRLAADGQAGYPDAGNLLVDLQNVAASIPPNGEAWDRLLKYVREHGAADAVLRQSA